MDLKCGPLVSIATGPPMALPKCHYDFMLVCSEIIVLIRYPIRLN